MLTTAAGLAAQPRDNISKEWHLVDFAIYTKFNFPGFGLLPATGWSSPGIGRERPGFPPTFFLGRTTWPAAGSVDRQRAKGRKREFEPRRKLWAGAPRKASFFKCPINRPTAFPTSWLRSVAQQRCSR